MADINTTKTFLSAITAEDGTILGLPAWTVLATIVGLFLSYFVLGPKKKALPQRWPHVPYTIPWVGNLLQVGGTEHVVTKLEEWATKYGGEQGIIRITLGGVEYVVLCREEETLEIERQRPFTVVRDHMMCSAVKSTGGYGLFATEGDEWKQDKRLMSPALNHASVARYFESIKEVSQRLITKWNKELGDNKSMIKVINKDCHHCLVDTSAKLFLGVEFDSLHKPDSKDAEDLRTLDVALGTRAFAPFPYWDIPLIGLYLDGNQWAIDRIKRKGLKVISEVENDPNADVSTFCAKAVRLNGQNNCKMTRERLIGNILTMFVGAQDTQSSSFITALWLLASDKVDDKLQDELYQEAISNNLDTDSPKDLLKNMPRTLSFLNEAQRMFAAVPIEMFEAGKDGVKLQGEILEPGTPIIRMTRFCGLNPNAPSPHVKPGPNGEDATIFVPRRWLTHDDKGNVTGCETPDNKHAGFLAFGCALNIRDCPGRFYADVAMVYMVGMIMKEYTLKLEDDHPHVGRIMGLTESVDRELSMVVTKRK